MLPRSRAFHTFCSASALLLLAAAPLAVAGPKDDLQAAAQKLADAPNYSWTTTITGGRGGGNTDGKTQKDGATLLTLPTRDGGTRQAVIQGEQIAVQTDDGWQDLSDMANQQGPGRFMAMMIRNFKTPADQVRTILADTSAEPTKADDGSYSITMGEDAAKKMMSFGRRGGGGGGGNGGGGAAGGGGGGPQISNAKATAKFWLGSDGTLSKIELHTTGTLTINGEDRDIDRTTTTEIKDVGSTTVEVPAEAKAKLAGGAAGGGAGGAAGGGAAGGAGGAAPATQPQ